MNMSNPKESGRPPPAESNAVRTIPRSGEAESNAVRTFPDAGNRLQVALERSPTRKIGIKRR